VKTAGVLLRPGERQLAWIQYRYGIALLFMNRLNEAKTQIEIALAVFRKPGSEDITGQIWCLNDLGNLAGEAGDNLDRLTYLEQALAIRRRTLPPDHPDLANGLNNVADALMLVGRVDQARSMAEEAVSISERVNGPEHGVTGLLLTTLSEIQRRQGQLDDAYRGVTRALPLCERLYGPSGTKTAETLMTLAQTERDLGRLADSEVTFRKLLNVLEDTSREGGPARLVAALREYDVLLKKLGRTQSAAEVEARIKALEAGTKRP
jgi:tetratricopeptide (TPR) repeat protein